jgi:hypothetical protein
VYFGMLNFRYFVWRTYGVGQFHNYLGDRGDAEMWAREQGRVNSAGSGGEGRKCGSCTLARRSCRRRDSSRQPRVDCVGHRARSPIQARSTSSHQASLSESVPVARFIVRHDANMTALSYGTDLVAHDVILLYGYSQTILVVMRTTCSLFLT